MCVDTGDSDVDLERLKIYQVLPDRDAGKHGLIRVIDESGEDYLYPARFFKPVVLPASLRKFFHSQAVA
ncbi:MAG: hypothetical protein HY700_06425 [Gemmatimonadetes bacterium]|nr:hypothetical protein [Gemmatimonadota bacterium]